MEVCVGATATVRSAISLAVLAAWGIYDRLHPAREGPPTSGRVFREQVPTSSVNPGDSGAVQRWLLRVRDTMVLRKWNKIFVRGGPGLGLQMLRRSW